jgi:putative DNA primase/helicase
MQTSIPELLFAHANRYSTPFMTAHGQLCAVPNGVGAHCIWALRSHRFRDWLAHTFFTEHERFPSRRALDNAISMLEARAVHSVDPPHLVDRRFSHRGNPRRPDAILIDLANEHSAAIEITPAGWNVCKSDSFFQRSTHQRPLPTPRSPAAPSFPLEPFLPTATSAGRIQIVAWLLAALRPIGPYPILILKGPHDTGKTTTARMLRTLVDPVAAPFLPKPATDSQLHRMAWDNRILAFDNVIRLAPAQAESLIRIATGAGFFIPEPHNSRDPISVDFQRPIILTVPENSEAPRLLHSSAFIVELRPANHRRESQILHEFDWIHPLALGALLDATAAALAGFAKQQADTDLLAWTTAAAPALALSPTEIAAALTPDPLIQHLTNFLQTHPEWSGTTHDLFRALPKIPGLPESPKGLTRRLGALNLPAFGIHLKRERTNHARGLRVTKAPPSIVTEAHSK